MNAIDALQETLDSKAALDDWIIKNRPGLWSEIAPMSLYEARLKLNAETGLEVMGCDSVAESFSRYLEAFKRQS